MTLSTINWERVASSLRDRAKREKQIVDSNVGQSRLNAGQRASLLAIADRIADNGIIIADEVGMGKTRTAVALAKCVINNGGRVAIIAPPGLAFQWQDELWEGEVEAPLMLRSLEQYYAAWAEKESWPLKQTVVLSHNFANWRIQGNSPLWRRGILPELFALFRGRKPRYYWEIMKYGDEQREIQVHAAAKHIHEQILQDPRLQKGRRWEAIVDHLDWPTIAESNTGYMNSGPYRKPLHDVIGLGLGIFDLVIIDESHKAKGERSGLSRLLNMLCESADARRVGMTATPVELDVSQWKQSLRRIGGKDLERLDDPIEEYRSAVHRVRERPDIAENREHFKIVAKQFHKLLSPYIIRRNKKEDPTVLLYGEIAQGQRNSYRAHKEIAIEADKLERPWREALCAAEALSFTARQKDNSVAKRFRLTMGSGHGLSAIMDQVKNDSGLAQPESSEMPTTEQHLSGPKSGHEAKRLGRVDFWCKILATPHKSGDSALYAHPAITATVEHIEKKTANNEKVLVFGRFTAPMRALVSLLNARQMIRCLKEDQFWSRSKVSESETEAVIAACKQKKIAWSLDEIDAMLKLQYSKLQQQRETFRKNLIPRLSNGLQHITDQRINNLFLAFKGRTEVEWDNDAEDTPRNLVGKALFEYFQNRSQPNDHDLANAFVKILNALSDRNEGDNNNDGELDVHEACSLWPVLEDRLREEHSKRTGDFARLMYGETSQSSRRMMQLAFNRHRSYPMVLVAQSKVGREGLNLHKACRNVVLFHPEWNPGVVEQQVGRVDRYGSMWAKLLEDYGANSAAPTEALPKINIYPVIFKGTYDQYNWKVLQERWDDLRAQLHGDILPPRLLREGDESVAEELARSAPDFSPVRKYKNV
ncbi:helicase-related protein [Pseudodesulfovibrio portus]|uniref:Helicase ATP-binding domain-containing protein n=1 Tax=Pseudodesulfovibrio portus TaxID=231439 RepID=A0ABM8AQ06_9BACT|nr:helicase-related protein [Pseudodesulfovibrio portus]BDQ33394.1 hypothetical protein JCM14722_09360 [Pseudodesulfovibrio portus]